YITQGCCSMLLPTGGRTRFGGVVRCEIAVFAAYQTVRRAVMDIPDPLLEHADRVCLWNDRQSLNHPPKWAGFGDVHSGGGSLQRIRGLQDIDNRLDGRPRKNLYEGRGQ